MLLAFDYDAWAEVVPLTRMADAETAFREWLRINGLREADTDPEDILKQVSRLVDGSAVRYFVRRTVRDQLLGASRDHEDCPGPDAGNAGPLCGEE